MKQLKKFNIYYKKNGIKMNYLDLRNNKKKWIVDNLKILSIIHFFLLSLMLLIAYEEKKNNDNDNNDNNDNIEYKCDDINNFEIQIPTNNNNKNISSITLYVNEFKIKKFDHVLSKYNFESKNELHINRIIKIEKYYNSYNEGGSLQIFSNKSIIIGKNGKIDADCVGPDYVKYSDEDIDENKETSLKFGEGDKSGGIIEIISGSSIINNGIVSSSVGGSINIKCANEFINNGMITNNDNNNKNINILCKKYVNNNNNQNDENINIKIINNDNIKFTDNFSKINKMFPKKINLSIYKHNGHYCNSDQYHPIHLLLKNDNRYHSESGAAKDDYIIFAINKVHLIKTIKIKNYNYDSGIKEISLYLGCANNDNIRLGK